MKWFTIVLAGVILAAQEADISVLRDRLDKYLIAYEPELSTVVAKEHMEQRDEPSDTLTGTSGRATQRREIDSEVAFIALPGSVGWLGFRRVLEVDRKSTGVAGPALAELLSSGTGGDSQAQLLLAQSAMHNLGAARTNNLPNLPLEFLHQNNRERFAYRLDGREKVAGIQTIRLELRETTRPTIIRRPDGGDMPSTVTAWIEPDTGKLRRARVRTHDPRTSTGQFDVTVWVEFREEPTLKILVPSEMREEFYTGRNRAGSGTAKYSDYRRFQTTARIVPQP